MSFISNKLGQFRYFDKQLGHPDWSGKMVLDFGGNIGNILAEPECRIDADKYWCIDVSRDAIERGKQRFPEAHWIFYNRHNFEFNPDGIERLPVPDPRVRFDYILCYSVFTHTSKREMLELVDQLRRLLKPGGTLAFTFLDPRWTVPGDSRYPYCNLKWRLEKRREINPAIDISTLYTKGSSAEWCTLINDSDLYLDGESERVYATREKEAYITLCTSRHIQSLFPGARTLPPPSPERQHCCILKAESMRDECTLSVIIPSYNRAGYLPEALDSIFQQNVPGLQVIVVDDGSTDDTSDVVRRYGQGVEYVYQKNLGTAHARNVGLERARGRLISFLDSDDVWLPNKVDAELAVFDSHPEAEAVISDSEAWREGKLVSNSWFGDQGLFLRQGPEPVSTIPPLWIRRKLFATCCLTMKRTVLERLGGRLFDTSLATHEDWDFSIRLFHGFNVWVLPQLCARVRRFEDGTRKGRPLPGTPYSPQVKCTMEYRRYRVLERAHRLGLPDNVVERLEEYRTEAARNIVENYRGWTRPNLARLVGSEVSRGAFANAASILLLSVLPSGLRPGVRSVIEYASAKQQSSPARAGV